MTDQEESLENPCDFEKMEKYIPQFQYWQEDLKNGKTGKRIVITLPDKKKLPRVQFGNENYTFETPFGASVFIDKDKKTGDASAKTSDGSEKKEDSYSYTVQCSIEDFNERDPMKSPIYSFLTMFDDKTLEAFKANYTTFAPNIKGASGAVHNQGNLIVPAKKTRADGSHYNPTFKIKVNLGNPNASLNTDVYVPVMKGQKMALKKINNPTVKNIPPHCRLFFTATIDTPSVIKGKDFSNRLIARSIVVYPPVRRDAKPFVGNMEIVEDNQFTQVDPQVSPKKEESDQS